MQPGAQRKPFAAGRPCEGAPRHQRGIVMGKYLVGWLLGIPVFVLVILYFFFH